MQQQIISGASSSFPMLTLVKLASLCCIRVTTAMAAALINFKVDVVANLLASPFFKINFQTLFTNYHYLVSGTVFVAAHLL